MTSTSGTRARVLAAVRSAPEPVTIEDLAADLDIHPNTVRFHAGALEGEGLVSQGRQPTGGKGRPRTLIYPTERGARSGRRNYELLSTVLLAQLAAASERPADVARAAGKSWGTSLAARPNHDGRSAAQVLDDFLADMSFEPDRETRQKPGQILLRNCPFRELVDTHQELVCSLHSGLLEGLVSDRPETVELIPFHSTTSCLVRLCPSM
ncbi:helix-turn-helix domain-containing protein [Nostocoides sp. F2B08]|uniref:helix-turn-helix transcriptional regulator n=1 Tax=Nostocoides sp. F2B08 TaxID=2653936 RepID=UPI001262BB53|nr:helix-turn-helix domain-containing protein [Tetrasphaera sp. F2B08]KAB7744202.1 helix-turn-helix domain-containing protein [Tetrasphaera sp. F2B08]